MMSDNMKLPQGDLRLLESDLAKRLLASTVPARFAYMAADGTPRVLPTWFHWTGEELVMPTFAQVDQPGTVMARIALRPAWAGVIDFETRLPGSMAQSN
jgi:hypothetical protein